MNLRAADSKQNSSTMAILQSMTAPISLEAAIGKVLLLMENKSSRDKKRVRVFFTYLLKDKNERRREGSPALNVIADEILRAACSQVERVFSDHENEGTRKKIFEALEEIEKIILKEINPSSFAAEVLAIVQKEEQEKSSLAARISLLQHQMIDELLEDLRLCHPDLCRQFEQLRQQLEEVAAGSLNKSAGCISLGVSILTSIQERSDPQDEINLFWLNCLKNFVLLGLDEIVISVVLANKLNAQLKAQAYQFITEYHKAFPKAGSPLIRILQDLIKNFVPDIFESLLYLAGYNRATRMEPENSGHIFGILLYAFKFNIDNNIRKGSSVQVNINFSSAGFDAFDRLLQFLMDTPVSVLEKQLVDEESRPYREVLGTILYIVVNACVSFREQAKNTDLKNHKISFLNTQTKLLKIIARFASTTWLVTNNFKPLYGYVDVELKELFPNLSPDASNIFEQIAVLLNDIDLQLEKLGAKQKEIQSTVSEAKESKEHARKQEEQSNAYLQELNQLAAKAERAKMQRDTALAKKFAMEAKAEDPKPEVHPLDVRELEAKLPDHRVGKHKNANLSATEQGRVYLEAARCLQREQYTQAVQLYGKARGYAVNAKDETIESACNVGLIECFLQEAHQHFDNWKKTKDNNKILAACKLYKEAEKTANQEILRSAQRVKELKEAKRSNAEFNDQELLEHMQETHIWVKNLLNRAENSIKETEKLTKDLELICTEARQKSAEIARAKTAKRNRDHKGIRNVPSISQAAKEYAAQRKVWGDTIKECKVVCGIIEMCRKALTGPCETYNKLLASDPNGTSLSLNISRN